MRKREREKRRCNKQEFPPLHDAGGSISSCTGRVLSGKFERDVLYIKGSVFTMLLLRVVFLTPIKYYTSVLSPVRPRPIPRRGHRRSIYGPSSSRGMFLIINVRPRDMYIYTHSNFFCFTLSPALGFLFFAHCVY